MEVVWKCQTDFIYKHNISIADLPVASDRTGAGRGPGQVNGGREGGRASARRAREKSNDYVELMADDRPEKHIM